MTRPEAAVREARERRDAARAALDARLAMLRPENLRSRAIDTARGQAVDALETGLDVARESKGVIAGVVGLLGLWFMRKPLAGWLETMIGAYAEQGENPDDRPPAR